MFRCFGLLFKNEYSGYVLPLGKAGLSAHMAAGFRRWAGIRLLSMLQR